MLDTHVLIWALGEPHRLAPPVRALLEDPDQEVLFSAASLWEISIKAALGRTDFKVEPREILAAALGAGFVELPVRSAAALVVADLPLHHRDPFDRLLVAQALTEPARLYTVDAALEPYSELVVRV